MGQFSSINTPAEYTTAALRTDVFITFDLLDRLIQPGMVEQLRFHLAATRGLERQLDQLKRHIFYGEGALIHRGPDGAITSLPVPHENMPAWFDPTVFARRLHAALGLATEACEFLEVVILAALNDPVGDMQGHQERELGDVSRYLALGADALGTSLQSIWEQDIDILQKRYPSRFTEEYAVAQADFTLAQPHLPYPAEDFE